MSEAERSRIALWNERFAACLDGFLGDLLSHGHVSGRVPEVDRRRLELASLPGDTIVAGPEARAIYGARVFMVKAVELLAIELEVRNSIFSEIKAGPLHRINAADMVRK